MPDYKRQHYVPRCYLKPFSLDRGGAAINLYNISRDVSVSNASLKGQCAKDYLYGADLKLEHLLQYFEGEYARIVRVIESTTDIPTQYDLEMLRDFSLLQYSRTEMAMKRMRMMFEGMHNATYEGYPVTLPKLDISERTMMLRSIQSYTDHRESITDLKVCVVKNRTQMDFVTSDDPAIFTSRYYIQRLQQNNFGLGSSGAVFFLPLSPRLLVICYDCDMYIIPNRRGCYVSTSSLRDVSALNELQYLKAAENIYFSSWNNRQQIETEFHATAPHRPDAWCRISVFVPDGFNQMGERHRLATDEERSTSLERLIQISNLHPEPSRWFSKLRFRNSPRTFSDGSAAGHVRRHIWETRHLRS